MPDSNAVDVLPSLHRLCGGYCGAVLDAYYPDDAAHTHAANQIARALAEPTFAAKVPPDPSERLRATGDDEAAVQAGSEAGSEVVDALDAWPHAGSTASGVARRGGHALLPPIDLSRGKLFFQHVHKASGTAFLSYLRSLEVHDDALNDLSLPPDWRAPTS